jgi:hypothetical protein
MHIEAGRISHIGISLLQDTDLTLFAYSLLGGGDRLRPTYAHGHHHSGKQDEIANRHNNQCVRRQRRDV